MNDQDLITKFFTGEISDDELLLLRSWLELDPENREGFDEQNEVWQLSSFMSGIDYPKLDLAWKNMTVRVGINSNDRKSVMIFNKNKFRILVAAATVACLIGISGLIHWVVDNQSDKVINTAVTRITTNEGDKANILLSDSTKITLNSFSSLLYDNDYNITDRVVNLTGEAFFDVNTNAEKPFVVQLGKIRIFATGTRFNVYSFPNEGRVETTLEEGIIQVFIDGLEPIWVNPGQQVIFFKASNKVQVRDVDTYSYSSWRENKLQFKDTPLEEVLRQIGRKYKVHFEISDPDLLNLEYTATFFDESLEEVMQMLKTVSPITYRIKGHSLYDGKQSKPEVIIVKRKV